MLNKKTGGAPKGTFWDWLTANTERVRTGRTDHKIMDELSRVFERYYPGLTWEIGPEGAERMTFFVSADGRKARFARVEKVVRSAPAIPGWEVRAFRARCPLDDVSLEIGSIKLTYDDVWCLVEPAGRKAEVTLFVRGWSDDPDPALSSGVGVLLGNAVGEYDAAMRVAVGDVHPLPDPPPDGAVPLRALADYLDRHLPPGPG